MKFIYLPAAFHNKLKVKQLVESASEIRLLKEVYCIFRMLTGTLLVSVLVIVLYKIYDRVNKKYQYFEIRNIAYKRPTFLFGNSGQVFFKRISIHESGRNIYNEFPNEK